MSTLTDSASARAAIVVDGATGYLGSHLVSVLCRQGYPVRCLVRAEAHRSDVEFLKSCGAHVCEASWSDSPQALIDTLAGAAQVIHLIGSIAPRRGESLAQLHVEQTRLLIDRCLPHNLKRIVMVSALGTTSGANNQYHATKWQAEELLRAACPNSVIVRPSLVIGRLAGRRDSKLVQRYRHLISQRRSVPLIAGGANRIQPIFIGDLVEALSVIIGSDRFDGATIELGGSEVITMISFIEQIMAQLETKRSILNLPVALARMAAIVCQSVQPVPLVSWDQVTLATMDNVCSNNMLELLIGRSATPLADSLASYGDWALSEESKEAKLAERT